MIAMMELGYIRVLRWNCMIRLERTLNMWPIFKRLDIGLARTGSNLRFDVGKSEDAHQVDDTNHFFLCSPRRIHFCHEVHIDCHI